MKGPPMQKPITMNLSMPRWSIRLQLIVGVGIPRPVDLDRASGLAAGGRCAGP